MYYWREFCVSKWVGLDNKNSLKHEDNSLKQLKTATCNPSSPQAYILKGLQSEGYLPLRFGGASMDFQEGPIIRILQYIVTTITVTVNEN